MPKLMSPVTYQGGKQRVAKQIVDIIFPFLDGKLFFDLCCGSGAITLELLERGYPKTLIQMVDAGPWGLFWNKVGTGTFNMSEFKWHLDQIPQNKALVKSHLENLSRQPVDENTATYIYLILQAGSFGGKAIWIKEEVWQNTSFRSFWQPTATSNRRSHVNPMMPMPETLFARAEIVCQQTLGIQAECLRVETLQPPADAIVYVDPPYQGTTGYGHALNVLEYATAQQALVFVSEGLSLTDESHLIATGREKGGISGDRKINANQEWLSVFRKK